jgi:hypothetical protein
MIYLIAACCAGIAVLVIVVPWLFDAICERRARREWYSADADWAVRQITSEYPLDEPVGESAEGSGGQAAAQVTEPLRAVQGGES